MQEIAHCTPPSHPEDDFDWVCSLRSSLVYVGFDKRHGYRVFAGSLMSGEIDERWSETKKEAIAMGLLRPAPKGCWQLTENILVNSSTDAASIFTGIDFANARWVDRGGKEVRVTDLPASRG